MASLEVRRRALFLFERLLDLPPGAPERAGLFAGEPAGVVSEVAALEAAEAGAAERFATSFTLNGRDAVGPRPLRAGAYRLIDLIGEGGMGEVWRAARDDGLFDHVVAVKLIRPGILSDTAAARFVEERNLLARLDHPGIARLIDGGVSDGWPYLITEYVEGETIDVSCRDHALPLERRVALVREAARAIQAAHGRLIVHADIKPANLMVTPDGHVKLLDFGIARRTGEREGADDPVLQPMTRAYASPQRIAGAPSEVADDIYAAGMLLKELAQESGTRGDLAAIVSRATACEPEDRYATMEAFGADLDRWRDRLPVAARAATFAYRAERLVARHWLAVTAATLALLLLIVVAIIATRAAFRAETARAAEVARVADLRNIVHYLLFDLQDRMARQPNMLALRTEVAERSQLYLDRLAAQADAAPALRMEAASGLIQLAEYQGKPARASLGQTDRARRNLDRAAALLAGLSGADAMALLARIRIEQAAISTMVDNDLRRSEALLATAGTLIGGAGRAGAGHVGDYLLETAFLREWQNRYVEAIALARRVAAMPPPHDPREAVLLAARVQDLIGESIYYSGDHVGSIPPYRREIALLEEAARRWSGDTRIVRALARARWALGSNLLDIGQQPAERLAMLEQGSRELGAIVAADHDDADAVRMLDILETGRAQALAEIGRADEGIALLAASVEHRRRRWQSMPTEAMRLRDYAIDVAALGDMQAEHRRIPQACDNYALAGRLFSLMERASRLSDSDRVYSYRLLNEARARHCR